MSENYYCHMRPSDPHRLVSNQGPEIEPTSDILSDIFFDAFAITVKDVKHKSSSLNYTILTRLTKPQPHPSACRGRGMRRAELGVIVKLHESGNTR